MDKKVLFIVDIDGTLIWSNGTGADAFDLAVEEFFGKVGLSLRDIDCAGRTDPEIMTEFFVEAGNPRETAGRLFRRILPVYYEKLRELVRTGRHRIEMCPYVWEGLTKMEKIGFLVLGTGNMKESAYLKLAPYELGVMFPTGGFGDDSTDRTKILETAKSRAESHFGVSFEDDRVFVVGDSPRDIIASRKAGFRTIIVGTGKGISKNSIAGLEPDFFIDDFSQIDRVLERILEEVSADALL